MNNSKKRTMLNKLCAVIATTVMATAGLAMVSAPAHAGATSTPILVTYDAGGSSGTGFVDPASNGATDVASTTGLVTNNSPAGGTGNFASVYKCDWHCWDYGRYGGAYIWKGNQNPNFSLMPTGAGTTGTSISVKAYAAGGQVGKKVMIRLGFADNQYPNQVLSSTATLLAGWNTYTLIVAPDVNASHRYWAASLVFDEYTWAVNSVWVADVTTFYFDDISFPDAGTQTPSTCFAAKPCSSRIDWAGSTGVSKGFHNVKAETDISVTNSYYAKGVGVYQAYAKAGSTFTLKFLVKDENGNIRPNLGVALRANKAYSGSSAHWVINGTAVSPAGANDGGIFSDKTDANGYVSFTVKNTDTNPQPIADPTIEDKDTTSFGTFALLQDSGDTTEALDIIEIHAYGLGFKIGNNSSYNAGVANGYLTADGSAVIQIPLINYNSSFAYTVTASKGVAYLAGPMIVINGVKDGEATTITLKMTDGTETATKIFGAKFTSTLSMKSPASISYDPVKKTVTCNNASYTKAPTDTAYYLYLNRVLKGGKKFGTTTGLQWMYRGVNLGTEGTEGATATSATWSVPASWNTSNIARVYCETQAYGGNDEVRSLSAGFTIPRLGKYVPRTSTPTKLKPTAVTMRLVEPALIKDPAGKASNYFDWTYNSVEANWAQYYGKNLAFIYKYMSVGATTTLKWKVTDTDSGSALDNFPVSLIINKNYGGIQNATFSYVVSGEKKLAAASPANSGTGETVIAGMTDDEGYITFVITNTNTATQAEAKPAALNAMQPTGGTDLHSQITLTAGLAQTKESIDLIEFHIVKP
jgi:hypothetical protein